MADRAERAQLAQIAYSQDGVREVGGNNCGPKVREYQAATWLAPDPWPWCAAFVCWCVREWMRAIDPHSADPAAARQQEAWRPRTAGAFDLVNWARSKGLKVLSRTAPAEAGDIVIYEMSHCGIVLRDSPKGAPIRAVEGNTGPAGKRDAVSGDGVFTKTRDRALVRSLIRLERA